MSAARPGREPVHLLTLRLSNLCGEPSGTPRGGQGTTDTADVNCQACINAGLRALVLDMLGALGPGPTAAGFAVTAGQLGVKGADGKPLAGYEVPGAGLPACCADGECEGP